MSKKTKKENLQRGTQNQSSSGVKTTTDVKEDLVDLVDKAENVMKAVTVKKSEGRAGLSSSQIRKFLTAITSVKNKIDLYKMHHREDKEKFSRELALDVKLLKTTLYYQASRDNSGAVKNFVTKTDLPAMIDDVGRSYEKFHELYRYIEALVAFHKYYGKE